MELETTRYRTLTAFVIAWCAFAFLLIAFGANPVAAGVLAFLLLAVAKAYSRVFMR